MPDRLGTEPFLPAYGHRSLADLIPSVAATLGLEGYDDHLGLPPASRICVLLVDGLGDGLLATARDDVAPLLRGLRGHAGDPLTCGVPSTTVTSLACIGTGRPPGEHGLLGYTFRLQGHGLFNALRWHDAVDPLIVQPHETIFEELGWRGVEVFHVGPRLYDGSGLTQAALRGTTYLPAETWGERLGATVAALERPGPGLVFTYVSELDGAGHRKGVASGDWGFELALVDRLVERLSSALPPGTLLVVTGDHGMVDADLSVSVDVEAAPQLQDGLALLGGEPRLRHVYTRDRAADDVAATWREVLGDLAWVRTRDEAVGDGWFGPEVLPSSLGRLGDVIVACRGRSVVLAGSSAPHESRLIGQHGSLTPMEMLVPLLVVPG